VEPEPASSPPWRMLTRAPPVGGQALSRRQPGQTGASPLVAPAGQPSCMKSARRCEVSDVRRVCSAFVVDCRSRQETSGPSRSSWLRLRRARRAQPKTTQVAAGETTFRAVPQAKAVGYREGPSGSLTMEGVSDRESPSRFTRRGWQRSRLVARRGSLRFGGLRAGRPVTGCQRPRTRRAGTGRERRTAQASLQAEVGARRESAPPIGRVGETRSSPIVPRMVGCWSLKMWIARRP
jgi:hypothetical protein